MAYPQLMRRRKVFDELLPSGESVDEAVMRLSRAPSIMPINDPPLTRPRRVAPVVSPDEPQIAGQYNSLELLKRPRIEPVLEPVVNNVEPFRRPIQPVEPLAPTIPDPTTIPLSRSPVLPGTVMTELPPIMTEAGMRPVRRNTGDALADELDYRDQLERYKPKNHNSRLAGIGLGALRGLQRGGLFGAIFGAGRGLIDKSADEKDARLEAIPVSDQNIQRQFGQRKVMSDLETEGVANDYRRAQIPYLLARPELEADKLQAKRDYDSWRMKSGDRKADTYENYIKWRMENGDRRATSYEDYLDFQKNIGERKFGEVQRHNQASEDIGRAGIGVRQESNDISRERIGAGTPQQAAKERAAAQRLLSQERAYRVRAASAKTQEAADELNATADQFREDALTQYPDYVEEDSGQASGAAGSIPGGAVVQKGGARLRVRGAAPAQRNAAPTRLPKLSEAQIRAAALSHNPPLDPDKAVERARSKGRL